MEEDRQWKGQNGDSAGTSLQARDTREENLLENPLETQMWKVIIAIKRATWQTTAGQKVVENKVKGQRAEKGQTEEINQIRHKKQSAQKECGNWAFWFSLTTENHNHLRS